MISLYQQHVENWKDCTRCTLSSQRKNVVLCRGTLPCDILFLGEAPGQSEDVLGIPFSGPAGHLQNRITKKAFERFPHLTFAYTNLVACIPLGEDGKKLTEPEHSEILSCRPRLQEFYEITKSRLIVCVGKLASSWLDRVISKRKIPAIDITHPAAILRANFGVQALMEQKNVIILLTALEELEEMKTE